MHTTLLIMAAGMGSRFGGGIKQLAPVGPSGEIIMDYSIHDALEAGFNKVVFIIRKDLEEDFRRIIGDRIEKICPCAYAFQEVDNLPGGFTNPEGRTKPWGTGHAVLACKGIVDTPEKLDAFIRSTFINVLNSIAAHREEHRLSVLADIIKNAAAETAEDDDENAPAQNYDLLKIYNEEKGLSLTQAACLLNNDFVSWCVGVIRDVSIMLDKPSKLFNKNKKHYVKVL